MKPVIAFLTALLTVVSPALALVEGEFLYQFGGGNLPPVIVGYNAVNEAGQIIVGGGEGSMIFVFDACGNFLFDVPAEQKTPSVAVNFDGQILALSDTVGIAYVYSPQGELLFRFGMGHLMQGAYGACFNEAGDMLLCDTASGMVVVFDSCGNFLFNFGMPGSSTEQFMSPKGICTDSDGNIYVTDTNNNRVQVFDYLGHFLFSFGSPGTQPAQFMSPQGIAISPFGEIAVADTVNGRVQIFDECGNLLKVLKDTHTTSPVGVTFNEDGILYVTDKGPGFTTVLAYR